MKPRGVSEGFQILDDLRIDARLYALLEHHAETVASGIDVQGLIQLAVCVLLEADHPKLCPCLTRRPAQQDRGGLRGAAIESVMRGDACPEPETVVGVAEWLRPKASTARRYRWSPSAAGSLRPPPGLVA